MKKFHFRGERVLEWRRLQARAEESKLETIHAELRGIDAKEQELREQAAAAERAIQTNRDVTDLDLAALAEFRRHTASERSRLNGMRADARRRLARQMDSVVRAQRAVKLLENLRERRWRAWQAEMNRETDREAGESYMARWRRIQ
jgi:hypothetical protein